MGKVPWSSEVFNCSAPDTGNMEVFAKYGTPEHKDKWLTPLMEGKIRSAFLMTEPRVASSDATNIETSIRREGDEYVINGRKWWSSGVMHPRCDVYITVIRALSVFGHVDSPHGHAEVDLNNVRVPASNLLLGEGRGFEIAQGRLGPGRIHHCMRLIGCAERALELMCKRVNEREAFGRYIKDFSSIRQDIAKSRCEIEQARLLTLSAADKIDKYEAAGAKDLIAMIKIVAPNMASSVIDRAIQAHGGMGVSGDTPLASYYSYARTIRLADGPDEVHMHQLGRNTVKQIVNS